MRRDVRDVSGGTFLALGGFLCFMGAAIVCVALGWIRVDPSSLHAPRWVLGLSGGVFALLGGLILYYAVRNTFLGGGRPPGSARGEFFVAGWLVGGFVVTAFAAVAAWIAFGPGERQFSGSLGLGGISLWGTRLSGESVGRAVFGIGAVLTGALAVWGWLHGIRRLMGGGEEEPPEPPG